jgi:hypothetical protein
MCTIFNDNSEREWLEDSKTRRFSRVTVGREDSTWVCNTCGQDGADPWEYGCENCGEEADAY